VRNAGKDQADVIMNITGNIISGQVTERELENISAFITELRLHPNTFPLLSIHTLGNLKRIIDTITIEKTGLTYMKHFQSNTSAIEFTSILNTVDYLYFELSGLPTLVERASLNHSERQMNIETSLIRLIMY
jgi:hypothetical protein